jgi:hypothetical protein
MFFMLSVPSGAAKTSLTKYPATSNAPIAIAATIITWLLPAELKTTSAAPEAISVWDTFSPWFFFLRDTLDTDMTNKYV